MLIVAINDKAELVREVELLSDGRAEEDLYRRHKETSGFGLGANLDWSGSDKIFGENYGPFVRWEF